jgi:isochorismate synthase
MMAQRIMEAVKRGKGFVLFREPFAGPQFLSGRVETAPLRPEAGFYITPFRMDGDDKPLLIHTEVLESFKTDTSLEFPEWTEQVPDSNPTTYEMDQPAYCHAVQLAVDEIIRGRMKKVVLSRAESHQVEGLDPFRLFRQLSALHTNAFCYLFWTPDSGMWIGATPETLVSHRSGTWHTLSLAGTLPRGADVAWTPKEEEEQELVTNEITWALGGSGLPYRVGVRHTFDTGTVVHLATDIEIEAPPTTEAGLGLARLLHPTPAVCGLPVDMALEAIPRLEQRSRSYYTGFLGPVGLEDPATLYVNLRCAQVFRNRIIVHVGAGITRDSVPEKEWEETRKKAETILGPIMKTEN